MITPLLQLLVIVNNPADYLQISEYLKESFPGSGIYHADTLQQGIGLTAKKQIDAIILDITADTTQQHSNNIENSFQEIFSKTFAIPIILLTDASVTDTAIEKLKNAAQDLISKNDCSPAVFKKSIQYSIAASELKKSEARYKHLFYNNPLPMCAYNRSHKFIMVNDAALHHYRYSEEEFMGLTIDKLQADTNDLAKFSCLDDKDIVNESDKYKTCMKHRKKNGEIIDVEIKSHDTIIDGQEVCLIVINDITEKNRATKQLRESEEMSGKLQQTNKELQQFSYITSHNLRAPLSNLSALIQLLDIPSVTDPNTAMLLEKFEECTLKLNNTVNDLINILIIKNDVNSKKEQVDIKETFEKVVQSVETIIQQKNVCVTTEFNHTAHLNYNRVYLESILLNLVTNAVKYSSPDRTPEISVITENSADGVKLRFADNGIGIDLVRNKDRIFGLYQRFHDNDDSIGLGLYLVEYQIKAMGGKIDVESEVDVGTTFIITFKNQ